MKRFYLLLGVLVIVGGALLYVAGKSKGGSSSAVTDVPPANDGFKGYTLGSDSAPVEVVAP